MSNVRTERLPPRTSVLWGVYTVWLRHFVLYRRTVLINCLPPVSEPIVYLLAFGYGLGPLVGSIKMASTEVSYLHFIAPGMMAVGALFQSFIEGSYGTFIRVRYRKSWHTMLTAPLDFGEIFFGDALWGATKGAIGGLLTGIVAAVWGLYSWESLIYALPVLFLGGFVFTAFGMAAAGCAKTIDHLNIPLFLFVVPMFALCGTYFPRSGLPDWVERLADFLPLSALVDLLRLPLLRGSLSHGAVDGTAAAGAALGMPGEILRQIATLMAWGALFTVIAWRSNRSQVIH